MRTAEEANKAATDSVTGIERASMSAVEKAVNKASDEGLFFTELFIRQEVLHKVEENLRLMGYGTGANGKRNEVGMQGLEISWR